MEIVLGVIAFGVAAIALAVAMANRKALRDQLGRINKGANGISVLQEKYPEMFEVE